MISALQAILYFSFLASSTLAFKYFGLFVFPIREVIIIRDFFNELEVKTSTAIKKAEDLSNKIFELDKKLAKIIQQWQHYKNQIEIQQKIEQCQSPQQQQHRVAALLERYTASHVEFNELVHRFDAMEKRLMKTIQNIENKRKQEEQIIGDNFTALTEYADDMNQYLTEQERALQDTISSSNDMVLLRDHVRYAVAAYQDKIADLDSRCTKLEKAISSKKKPD